MLTDVDKSEKQEKYNFSTAIKHSILPYASSIKAQ